MHLDHLVFLPTTRTTPAKIANRCNKNIDDVTDPFLILPSRSSLLTVHLSTLDSRFFHMLKGLGPPGHSSWTDPLPIVLALLSVRDDERQGQMERAGQFVKCLSVVVRILTRDWLSRFGVGRGGGVSTPPEGGREGYGRVSQRMIMVGAHHCDAHSGNYSNTRVYAPPADSGKWTVSPNRGSPGCLSPNMRD